MEPAVIGLGAVAFLVIVALAFDFINGFHDAANSIATIVSTGVLKPHQAVVWAAFFNFAAVFVFHLKVAATIGTGIIEPAVVDHVVLIGGLVGAAVAKAGTGSLVAPGLLKTVAFIFVSPLLGFILAAALMIGVSWIFLRATPARVDRWFRRAQFVSASLYSLGHGGNDAQKTIGIIWMLLIAAGLTTATQPVPAWVVISCYVTIALGTAFGGWRIVKTMGQRITKLKPVGGCCAETGGAMTLFLATGLGIPVSTTHTITGSIAGVGATQGATAVRWGVAGSIVIAWILTIPCSALISAVAWWIGRHFL